MSPVETWAAYKPVTLSVPSYLPSAVQGKAYSYSFLNRVSGGTGKPYIWKFTGKLPSVLTFNVKTALLSGVVSKSSKVMTYTMRICATGAKKSAVASINTTCKTTRLKVSRAKTVLPASPQAFGTYTGNINYPDLNTPAVSGGCEAKTIPFTIEVYQNQTGKILGTSGTNLTLRWTMSGNLLTVLFETQWGEMGPKSWKWEGSTLSGELPLFCRNLSTNELVNQAFVAFIGQKK